MTSVDFTNLFAYRVSCCSLLISFLSPPCLASLPPSFPPGFEGLSKLVGNPDCAPSDASIHADMLAGLVGTRAIWWFDYWNVDLDAGHISGNLGQLAVGLVES